MNISKLREEIKKAMILKKETGNSNRYMTLKGILEKAQKDAKDRRQEDITDSMLVSAAKKEIKQLEDLKQYVKEGTEAYIDIEEKIATAKELLPEQITTEQVEEFIREHLEEINNIGQGMKLLNEKFGDSLDKKVASTMLKELMNKK